MKEKIKWTINHMPKSDGCQLKVTSLRNVTKASFFHNSFPQYSITLLVCLHGMADYWRLGGLYVKDESIVLD